MQDIVWAPDSDMSVSHCPAVKTQHLLLVVSVGTHVNKEVFCFLQTECKDPDKVIEVGYGTIQTQPERTG